MDNTSYFFDSRKRKVKVASFFVKKTIPEDVAIYQKLVFDKFNLNINQFSGRMRHPDFLDRFINNEDSDVYIFFDIDCIPLCETVYEDILQLVDDRNIFGVAQQYNYNNLNHVYASPSCFAITRNAYEKIGKPSFVERQRYLLDGVIRRTEDYFKNNNIAYHNNEDFYHKAHKALSKIGAQLLCDVGEEITYLCREQGINVNLWYPTSFDNTRNTWKLGMDMRFGNGTIYNKKLYHEFQIRITSDKFIDKCKEILRA